MFRLMAIVCVAAVFGASFVLAIIDPNPIIVVLVVGSGIMAAIAIAVFAKEENLGGF